MVQIKAKIGFNKKVKGNYFHCSLLAPGIAKNSHPGQFVDIKISDSIEPFLRRPLGIHRTRGASIEILYEVVGKGTELLSQKQPGEYLDVIGSLGTGFNYKTQDTRHKTQVLVAGGRGVAPLIFLAEKLREIPNLVLIGAKSKNKIICEKEFKDLGCDVKIATDDGSKGFKGYVSALLDNLLSTIDHRPSTIYACGPMPMLKEISCISKRYKIPAQISLEEHMACGIGACLGCVVKCKTTQYAIRHTQYEYRRVCKEGPVFDADEIVW